MIIRTLVVFFYCIILINIPANAALNDKSKKSTLLLIENEIYQIVKKNGLSKSDITIYWKKTISGDYNAIIKCNNPKKCNMSGVVISFSKANDANDNLSIVGPPSLRNKIDNDIKPLFNTGNPGPKFSPAN